MSWTLLEPPEKPEDGDSDFYVISEESTDEEDNPLRQEYQTNRERLQSRQEFEFVKTHYSLVVRSIFPRFPCTPFAKDFDMHKFFFLGFL